LRNNQNYDKQIQTKTMALVSCKMR
jgi:hypothetical protein